jgi:hypothetical protein
MKSCTRQRQTLRRSCCSALKIAVPRSAALLASFIAFIYLCIVGPKLQWLCKANILSICCNPTTVVTCCRWSGKLHCYEIVALLLEQRSLPSCCFTDVYPNVYSSVTINYFCNFYPTAGWNVMTTACFVFEWGRW